MALDAPFVAGAVLAWSLAAPPGPANALMAQQTLQRGFAAGWWTGVGAVAADLTMLALTAFGLLRVLDAYPRLGVGLGFVGAALMGYFALSAWRGARAATGAPEEGARGARGGFARAYAMIITSPFNLAWWATGGTLLVTESGAWGAAGFFVGLLAWVALWNALAREGARRVRHFARITSYGAAVALAIFALVLLMLSAQDAARLA